MALWSKWNTVYPNGTWHNAIKALRKLTENTLAAEIEGKILYPYNIYCRDIQC